MTMPSIPRNDSLRRPSEQKNLLRQQLIQTRSSMPAAHKKQLDKHLCDQLLRYVLQQHISHLAVYLPIRDEPDLQEAYTALHLRHVSLCLPVVVAKDMPLIFAQWQPDSRMTEGAFRTQIPAHIMPVIPQAILLPCVGFNTERFRLGYGGGYFDRTLNTADRPHTIGIAYAQSHIEFAQESHDIPLDVIVTETHRY